MRLASGACAAVEVPATSANLGPGYDSLGLALQLVDRVQARVVSGPSTVRVCGEGAGQLPTGEDHLVLRALREGLRAAGTSSPNVELTCENAIPHGRGLGSSAAAIVAGLALADSLSGGDLGREGVYRLATAMEGHPDNVAPAVFGAATVSWIGEDGVPGVARIPVAANVRPGVAIPATTLATRRARALLPPQVPHADAAFNAARAALLATVLATGRGDLMAATEDRLHQDYRASAMPDTLAAVARLRAAGVPAVVSGAGPSVLVLSEIPATEAEQLRAAGWRLLAPAVRGLGYEPIAVCLDA